MPRPVTPRIGVHAIIAPDNKSSNTLLSFKEALSQVEICHMREIEELLRKELVQQQLKSGAFTPLPSPYSDAKLGSHSSSNAVPDPIACLPTASRVSAASVVQSNTGPTFRECFPPQVVPHEQPSLDIPWRSGAAAMNWRTILSALLCKCVLNSAWRWDQVSKNMQGDYGSELPASISSSRCSRRPETSFSTKSSSGMTMNTVKSRRSQRFSSCCTFSTLFCKAIHPFGKLRLSWDTLGLSICVFELIMLPLLMAELLETNVHIAVGNCVYWTVDVVLAFRTGYLNDFGFIELRLRRIAKKYCRTWFPSDLALTILDWVVLGVGEAWSYGRALKSVLRFARIARFLRIFRLASRVQDQLGRVTSQNVFTVLRVISYIVVVVFLNHYVACAWCATWLDRANLKSYKYLIALHWSLAHCFLGSMDVYPESDMERMFTCLVLVFALAIFSIILSMITNDALFLRSLSEAKNRRNMVLLSFFSVHKLPTSLTCRVWHFVQKHKLFEGEAQRNDNDILELLPAHIQQEIEQARFSRVLRHHPFFYHYIKIAPVAVKQLCNLAIVVQHLFPEEELVLARTGHVQHMIFVEKGQLLYFPDDEPFQIVLGPNMWACEEALWGSSASISGYMLAGVRTCTIFFLSFLEFKKAAYLHHSSLPFLMCYAKRFVHAFNDACGKYGCGDVAVKDLLFNSRATIKDITVEAVKTETENGSLGILSLMMDDSVHSSVAADGE